MVQKISRGKGFRGVLDYLFHGAKSSHENRGTIIATNMAGKTPRQLAQEFGAFRQLRPTLNKAVFHVSLSLSPEDRKLDDTEFAEIATTYLARMGFKDCPHAVIRHHDTEHEHIHIVASRIKPDGTVVSDANDYRRGEAIMRELESEHQLQAVAPSATAQRKALTRGQKQLQQRQGDPIMKTQLTNLLDKALSQSKTIVEFIEYCERHEIIIEPHVQGDSDHISGIVYEYREMRFKGSDLGRGYTWSALTRKLVYEPRTHLDFIRKRRKTKLVPTIESTEPDKKRREQKRKLLEEDYHEQLMELFAENCHRIQQVREGWTLHFKNGGKITDYGDRASAHDMSDEVSALMLIRLAKHKGWDKVAFTGSDEFVYTAMAMALHANLVVLTKDDKQVAMLNEVQASMGALSIKPTIEAEPEPEVSAPPPPPADINSRIGKWRDANSQPETAKSRFRPGSGFGVK